MTILMHRLSIARHIVTTLSLSSELLSVLRRTEHGYQINAVVRWRGRRLCRDVIRRLSILEAAGLVEMVKEKGAEQIWCSTPAGLAIIDRGVSAQRDPRPTGE